MTRKPISNDIRGLELDPMDISWDSKDTMLYALGVGSKPEDELEFVFEGKGPRVVPTFGVIKALDAVIPLLGEVDINPGMILHGEQSLVLHRELPPDFNGQAKARIANVWDKGKAAVIELETTALDDDGPLCTNVVTLFIRGAGGFGGDAGPSTKGKNAVPDGDPDVVVEDVTRPEQAAIYRLSGDRNPLHVDPDFAKAVGFEEPFIHGLCTFGFVGRAVLKTVCEGDPARFKSLEARFTDQVYPADTIITKIWKTGEGEGIVQAETQKGNVVLGQARATWS